MEKHLGVKALAEKMEITNTGVPNVAACGLPRYMNISDMIADVMSLTIDDVLGMSRVKNDKISEKISFNEDLEAGEGGQALNWV